MFSDTFAGIRPSSAPAFVVAELVGGGLAVGAVRILYPTVSDMAGAVVVPHPPPAPATGGRTPVQ